MSNDIAHELLSVISTTAAQITHITFLVLQNPNRFLHPGLESGHFGSDKYEYKVKRFGIAEILKLSVLRMYVLVFL